MHEGIVADLRGHHLTQQQRPLYASGAFVTQEASNILHKERRRWIVSKMRKRSAKTPEFIPLPGCTEGKQETTVRGPRELKEHVRSSLRNEVDINDYTEMGDFFEGLCGVNGGDNKKNGSTNIYIGDSDQTVGSKVKATDSSREEPDDYDIEMAKVEEAGFFKNQVEQTLQIPGLPIFNSGNTERQTKRKRESIISPDSLTLDLPSDLDHDEKRRPSAGQWKSSPLSREGRDGQKKRKRESGISAESPVFDLPGDIDHDEKRRKLKTGTRSSQVPQDERREEESVNLGPCDSFCQGTAVADVRGQEDFRVAKAAAKLEIDQGNSDVPGLDPADRDGAPDRLQTSVHAEEEPLSIVTFPRAARFPERYLVNKSLLQRHGHLNKFRSERKSIKPSWKFRSFFKTRRQREVLLHKGQESWTRQDDSFMRSGNEIAEPGATLGAEFVAKSLLDVRNALPSLQMEPYANDMCRAVDRHSSNLC